MLQLSKRVEYGLIALRHMAMAPHGQVCTSKEIAQKYDLPYELLSKILQKLAKAGIVVSTQGVRGGYALARKPSEVRVSQILNIIEDEKPIIAQCYSESAENCSHLDNCTIRKPLGKVQENLNVLLETMTLDQIM
jgi:Rrf2 family protein